MYNAYVTRIKNLHKHPNADKLQIGECFGNSIIVSMEYENNQLGIYFPSDGQLSVEFAEANNLLRKKDEEGNNIGGYMDPDKRNVTAIRLRGEKSDGLFLPLKALESFGDINTLNEGDRISNFNGHEICCKYIPRRNHRSGGTSNDNKTRKKRVNIAPLFTEHADTEQLAYNLSVFKPGDEIEITLKMHGTSQRTAYLPIFKGYKRTFWDKVLRREGIPIYDWGYVSGTRRTVLENYDGGYYGSNEFREVHSKFFEGKLWKGEEIFYEVVGFTHTGAPIMSMADNKKLNDKEFVKQYGKTTVFSYGCDPDPSSWVPHDHCEQEPKLPQSDIYVYRMTMTNEDGDVVEYTPDFMRYRCEQMGVKCVPVFAKAVLDNSDIMLNFANSENEAKIMLVTENLTLGEKVKQLAEAFYDGPDPVGKTHVREGIVVRIVNRPKFCAYKHKNFSFKVLEGICKAEAETPDIEEAEDVPNELSQ